MAWPIDRIRDFTDGNPILASEMNLLQDGVRAGDTGQRLAAWNFDEFTQVTGGTVTTASPLVGDKVVHSLTGAPATLWKALPGLPARARIQMIRVLCESGSGSVPTITLQHQFANAYAGGMPSGIGVGTLPASSGYSAAGGYFWIDFGDGTADLAFGGDLGAGPSHIGNGYPSLKIVRAPGDVGVVPLLAAYALWRPAPLL